MIVNSSDMSLVIIVGLLVFLVVAFKILNNKRTVIKHELHGTVTYTINGYGGGEAQRIAEALVQPGQTSNVVPLKQAKPEKATAEDVR